MTVEIADIRNGLATNLKTVSVSRQVSAYPLTAPTPPSLIVMGFDKLERSAFGKGSFSVPFLVQGLAGLATNESAHIVLDKWLSPLGAVNVWTAIESDKSLGGKVDDVAVIECDGYQLVTVAPGVEYLGSTWHIQIEL